MLAMPESGGELHVYSLRCDEQSGKAFAEQALSEQESLRAIAAYGEMVVKLTPGDLIVFNAGSYFHHVAPVGGARTRWTQGGFLSRSCDGKALFCWT